MLDTVDVTPYDAHQMRGTNCDAWPIDAEEAMLTAQQSMRRVIFSQAYLLLCHQTERLCEIHVNGWVLVNTAYSAYYCTAYCTRRFSVSGWIRVIRGGIIIPHHYF